MQINKTLTYHFLNIPLMKKTNLFIICLFSLCCVLTLSAQDNDSYTLDFQQKIRPQFVSDITVNGAQGYLFIQHIQDFRQLLIQELLQM